MTSGRLEEEEEEEEKGEVEPVQDLLDQTFVYQNAKTGNVAPNPMTVRQLCKILCMGITTHITPSTRVLGVLGNGRYSNEWKVAKDIPVLREACSQFHYVVHNSDTPKTTTTTTKGPVGCKQLSKLLFESDDVTQQTKVWSPQLQEKGWFALKESKHLLAALEAFHQPPQPAKENAATTDTMKQQQTTTTFDQDETKNKAIQDELEAFLSSTVGDGNDSQQRNDDKDDEGYQSDGGTNYVKDHRTGNWIHEALAPSKPTTVQPTKKAATKATTTIATTTGGLSLGRKRKKAKFSSRNMKNWVYVTGLPTDTTVDEVATVFGRAGILDLDPETQLPKIKLYRHKDGSNRLKGDASVCFARPESVGLALVLLDEAPFRPSVTNQNALVMRVTRAKFEQQGSSYDTKRTKTLSNAQRKVARIAALQAVGWDEEGENGRITGGRKGLCIIVLKHMFTLQELAEAKDEDVVLAGLEKEIRQECAQWGTVEKITVFSKHPRGVLVVKFGQPHAASTAVKAFHGRQRQGRRIEATFWDGVTDYTVHDEQAEQREAEKRHEEFGEWLEEQELPEELRLQVEGE